MPQLAGKVAIVTGSSSGIGKAIALRFAEKGASVVVAARRQDLLDDVVAQIRNRGAAGRAFRTDVREEAQVDRLISGTVAEYGKLDILVNNAGIGSGGQIEQTSTERFDDVMATNLRGTFFCCRAGFRQMKKNGGGTIINMSSVAGVQAWSGTGTYSVSKHGIMALSRALAEEGRPHGIKVSAICPGRVAEDLVDATPQEIERSERISPYDVAVAAVYLATLGPYAVVHQIVVDRLGADW